MKSVFYLRMPISLTCFQLADSLIMLRGDLR